MIRITAFFILLSLLQVSASVYSQQTNLILKLENTNIEQVFRKIEEQSKFYFLYRSDLLKEVPPVSIQVNDAKLEDILNKILVPNGFSYEIDDRVVVIKKDTEKATPVPVEQKAITGTVKDKTGEPVPGVSVVVKGTTIGTITDIDGVFRLNLPADAKTLMFSFVGMKSQEIPVGNSATFKIVMEEETVGVDEVVVVGYGTQKKVNLTGAVSAVKMDEKMISRPVANVSSGLQGLVPGLAISQNSGMAGKNDVSMIIRGMGTVNNAKPLVVVDGMPDVDINRLNMNDIESISVLKDATSSAVYGSRAANGVILITTKSGKGQKTRINVTSSYGVESPTKSYEFMADYPRALTLEQRLAAVNTLRSNYIFKDGTIDQWMAMGMIDPVRYPNTDWWNIIMRTGSVQNHNITASGSNENSNFFISIGLLDEKGLQINNDYKRYNARFNYDYKVRKNMNVGAKFSGNWSKYTYALEDGFTDDNTTNTAGFDMQYAIAGILPYDPITGNYGGVMAYGEDVQAYNPYTLYVNSLNYQNRQEANVSGYWDWTPIKGLTARVDYAINYYNQFRYSANIPNTAFNFQTNSFGSRVYVGANAGIGNYTNTGYKTQLNGRVNYQTTIAKNHDVSAMFAYSEEYWYDRYQSGTRLDRLHPSLHELDAALQGTMTAGGNSSTEGLRSYIGRLNYTAFNKYIFEANFRYDGSSKFLPGSRYGFFPSASFGWRFTEENFLKQYTDSWLTNGKFRFSYGGLGNNSGVDRYEQQETLAEGHYMIGGVITKGLVNSKMVNTDLSWETSYVMNVGLDLGFLNNRFTTEIDYYDRLTTGMNRPSQMSLLLTGAYDAPRKNIGDLRNRGVEVNLNWKDRFKKIDYSVNFNASYNRTLLEKWNEFLSRGYTFLNMPYHFLYTYEDAGIAQTWEDVYNATPQGASPGDILRKDLNGDGKIDGNDKKAYPNIQRDRPTANFALNLNAAWKGFDISALFQGAAGRKDYWINIYNNVNFNASRYAATWDHWNNPWSVENRDGEWPRLAGSNNREETTFWLDDMSYIRLKNVQLGYTLKEKGWLKTAGIEDIRLYFSGENLTTLTKYRGLDPEKNSNASDAYPLVKTFSFGINIGI
jgi:TonB-linked SusC/RagA family outer membrane protein